MGRHRAITARERSMRLVHDNKIGEWLRAIAKRVDARDLHRGARSPTCFAGHDDADGALGDASLDELAVALLDEFSTMRDEEHASTEREPARDDVRSHHRLSATGWKDEQNAAGAAVHFAPNALDGIKLIRAKWNHSPLWRWQNQSVVPQWPITTRPRTRLRAARRAQ